MLPMSIRLPKAWEKAIERYMELRKIPNRHRAVLELVNVGLSQYGLSVEMPPERGKYTRE